MEIVDADGHVAEGASLALAAMQRFPEHISLRTDGRPSLLVEGRRYPDDAGPGAGCPPEHGLSTVEGIRHGTTSIDTRDSARSRAACSRR